MYASLFQKCVFFVLFYRSSIDCKSISKRKLENPEPVLAEVSQFKANEAYNFYDTDYQATFHVPLTDLRGMKIPDLETYGFTYVSNRRVEGIEDLKELSDGHKAALTADSVELVKKLTGATSAIAFTASFRSYKERYAAKPIQMIHSDMSPEGARYIKSRVQKDFLESKDPDEQRFGEHLSQGGKNVVILNVWRPIHTVEDHPFGLCKWNSISKEDQLNWNIKPNNPDNSIQAWTYRSTQEWFYINKQTADQVYLFIQHDSRAPDGHGINVAHASFNFEKDHLDRPERMSFESQIIAIIEPSAKGYLGKLKQKLKIFN